MAHQAANCPFVSSNANSCPSHAVRPRVRTRAFGPLGGGPPYESHDQATDTRLTNLPRAPVLMQEAKYGSHFAVETRRRKPANPDAAPLRDRYRTPVYLLAGLLAHVEVVLTLIPATHPTLVVAEAEVVGLLVRQRLLVLPKRPYRG